MIAATLSGTLDASTCSDNSANAASISVLTPE
jgi:hypothetical protein